MTKQTERVPASMSDGQGTTRQSEIEHAVRKLDEPCPFCGACMVQLWRNPLEHFDPYQVRCGACSARGPACDCGEESAVPMWLAVATIRTEAEAKAREEAFEEAANIADGFRCGACGMDGKAAAAIRQAAQPNLKAGQYVGKPTAVEIEKDYFS